MTERRGPGGRSPKGRAALVRRLVGLGLTAAALLGGAPVTAADPTPQSPPTRPSAAPAVFDPFDAAPPLQAERLRGLRPEIARTILRGAPGGEIALAVLAYPASPAAERARVALFVEIDGATFLDSNQSKTAQVEIYAYALTSAGAVGGYLAEAFTLDVGRHGEVVWSGGLRFVGWLELPAGSYELRVMVHNARSLAHGLVFTPLEVPATTTDKPALLPPMFAGSRVRQAWLAIRGRGGWRSLGESVYPFAAEGRALLPAARPVLVSGRRAGAFLLADRLPQAKLSCWLELLGGPTDEALPGERTVISRAPVEIGQTVSDHQGLASRAVSFVAPAAPPGRYDLRLTIDSPTGSIATPTLEVLLVEAQPQDRELTWSDLRAWDSPKAPPPEPDPTIAESRMTRTPQSPAGRGLRRLAARYRQALGSSLGEASARSAALVDLELEALGRSGEEPLERLQTAELLAAAELGRQQADLLLPLISVHDDLFHLYRRRHLFSLVAHTRRLLESLAEFYAALGGKPDVAAGVLASVGGYMQELRAPGDSRRLFSRALVHDPTNPPALLGLALSYEKYGDYTRAVERLESLLAARPELDEARLRLALNLERTGDRLRFREILGELAATERAGWVSAIACQELARSLLEAGAPEEAATVLERAVEQMPKRQALRILLAHVYDRQGQLERSWKSLEQTAGAARSDLRSERLTYDEWANGPLDRARRALAEDAKRLRQGLHAAIGTAETAGR